MPQKKTHRSVRLTFAYEGSDIKLVSQEPVEMIAPPSDEVAPAQTVNGFWFQLENAKGAALYKRVAHPPIRYDREVFSPEGEHSVARVPVEKPSGVFTVVMPDIQEADKVTLHGGAHSPAHPQGTPGLVGNVPQPVASFKLKHE
jgi:hypothetical protein